MSRESWATLLASALILGLFSLYVIRVEPEDLTWLVFALTVTAWVSAAVLGRAALRPPHIGALTERAVIAVVIALLGTISCIIVLNTDLGRPWFPVAISSALFRLSVLGVLAVPLTWLILWYLGRLGPHGEE